MSIIEAMYDNFCKARFPLPTEQQVVNLERRIRVELPVDYRQFILEFNGGYFTEPEIVPPVDECPLDRLTSLRGIRASHPSAELASDSDLSLFTDNDPVQTLPIGYTIMGNLLAVITHPEGRGSIFLKKAYSDQWFELADGIEAFFSLLREPVDE